MRFSPTTKIAPKPPSLRRGAGLVVLACLLGACAAQTKKPPAAAPTPLPTASAPAPAEVQAPKKTKPHPKPATAAVAAPKSPAALNADEVGYYMDVMQGRLKQAAGSGVTVRREGTHVVVALQAQFALHAAHAELASEQNQALGALARVLTEYSKTLATVKVHGDDASGAAALVGVACAQAVAKYLIAGGVAAAQIAAPGATPAPPGDVASLEARVELDIEPVVRAADTAG